MTVDETLRELRALGTEQNRKIYRRHGAGPDLYGVSVANLDALKKRIKVDHALAGHLWGTGNFDSRLLATRIADPKAATEAELIAWAADLDNYVVADALAGLIGRTALARPLMEPWTAAPDEWRGRVGWLVLAHLAMKDAALADAFFEPYLARIDRELHARPNRVRDAMNGALIAIGLRGAALEERALAVAARVGTVEVDHGATNCTTPDAAAYIRKARQRRRRG